MTADDRCPVTVQLRMTVRRCDLPAGHDGHHVTNDGCGRPEHYWPGEDAA